jgi:hypothetical protein
MMTTNPFCPSFGVTPPLLAGRETEILAFGDALDAGLETCEILIDKVLSMPPLLGLS